MKLKHLFVILFSCILFSAPSFAEDESISAHKAGMNAFNRREYQNAVYAFQNAIHLDPKLYKAHCMLGLSHILNDEPQKGEEIYLSAIKQFPDEWNAYILLAEFYETQESYSKALSYYNQALDLLPAKQKKTYQIKISKLKEQQKNNWSVNEQEKEEIITNIIPPLNMDNWRVALVEKKATAIHVVYGLKSENYRAGKWKQILDLTCTYTDTKDTAQFNKINEWLASQYRRSDADMDTISKTNNSRIYETILHDKKIHIIGYIFPAASGFCIAQFMQKTKMTDAIKTNLVKDIKKINVRKF